MIELKNINKSFDGQPAIKDINLKLAKNEIVVVLGSSGSGKTTLLRSISNLEQPNSGDVLINNTKLTAKNRAKLCLKIGMVFQGFNLFPHMDVLENLTYSPIKVLGVSKGDANHKAEKLLEQFAMASKVRARVDDLSGGQKQRVAICRALMTDPELMLFDEPTSALDSEVIKDLIDALLILKKKMGMLIVTHQLKFAKIVADRIIFMDSGQILCDQPAGEFFAKPKSKRAHLFLENVKSIL